MSADDREKLVLGLVAAPDLPEEIAGSWRGWRERVSQGDESVRAAAYGYRTDRESEHERARTARDE